MNTTVSNPTLNQPGRLERLSALADGESMNDGAALSFDEMADEGVRAEWDAYHVIGEVLRCGDLGALGARPAFVERLSARLAAEAVVVTAAEPMAVQPARIVTRAAANEPVFRWKMVAGFASLAAVVAISWNVVGGVGNTSGAQMASSPRAGAASVQLAKAETQVMIRNPRLDELLAAHKQAGGATALQMPSGFLRNATFEGPDR